MNRRAATLLALALAAPAAARADWQLVGTEEGIYRAYADPDTIRRDGASARMQGLYDFARRDFTPEGRALFSTRVQREYDCEGRRVRLLAHVDHAGHMGDGEAVSAVQREGRWELVVESSLDERFWRVACRAAN